MIVWDNEMIETDRLVVTVHLISRYKVCQAYSCLDKYQRDTEHQLEDTPPPDGTCIYQNKRQSIGDLCISLFRASA